MRPINASKLARITTLLFLGAALTGRALAGGAEVALTSNAAMPPDADLPAWIGLAAVALIVVAVFVTALTSLVQPRHGGWVYHLLQSLPADRLEGLFYKVRYVRQRDLPEAQPATGYLRSLDALKATMLITEPLPREAEVSFSIGARG